MTILLAQLTIALALIGGMLVGRRRGPATGIAVGLGVLAAGLIAYIGLVTLAMGM